MYKERDVVKNALKYLDSEYILIFTGARQVGKTMLLRHLYEKQKSKRQRAYFINLEDTDYLSLLNESPKNLFSVIDY